MQQAIICKKSLSEINKLISFTNDFAEKHSIKENYSKILMLIVEEYFTNFVKYQKPNSSTFTLNLLAKQEKIDIEINITGNCFNPMDYNKLTKDHCIGLDIILNLAKHYSHKYTNYTNTLMSSIQID